MKHKVAIVKYEEPLESSRKALTLSNGFQNLRKNLKVFIKPNIVFWTKTVPFPKFGVITTSRILEDMVILLKEFGIDDITIGEGTVIYNPKDFDTPRHAFKTLGYEALKKKYGIKYINVFETKFTKVDLGDDVFLNVNTDYLESDFLVNIPVMKTHAQTMVSLGIKNVKGLIDVNSRKKCHSADTQKDLHFMVAKLAKTIPESFTIIDGIFTNERGPAFDGKVRRSNLLVASHDVLSADKTAAMILGYQPSTIPHLVHVAEELKRPMDLSDVLMVGEPIDTVEMHLEYDFPYNSENSLPLPMEKMGIQGFSYPKYDLTMCTYCSLLTGAILSSVVGAWKGTAWDEVEVLTGKTMKPDPNKKHSILIGKCLYERNKDHSSDDKIIFIKSCPPSSKEITKAFHESGIAIDPRALENVESIPGLFMKRYEGKPEFDETFFQVNSA